MRWKRRRAGACSRRLRALALRWKRHPLPCAHRRCGGNAVGRGLAPAAPGVSRARLRAATSSPPAAELPLKGKPAFHRGCGRRKRRRAGACSRRRWRTGVAAELPPAPLRAPALRWNCRRAGACSRRRVCTRTRHVKIFDFAIPCGRACAHFLNIITSESTPAATYASGRSISPLGAVDTTITSTCITQNTNAYLTNCL